MQGSGNKILIIRNSALGDVAMVLTVVYSVCRQYPQHEFYLLTRPFFSKIFINKPDNLHIIAADFKGEYHGVKGLMRCIRHLRTYHFVAVADLHNVLRSWIIDWSMRLSGVPVVMVNKKREARLGDSLKDAQKPFIERYAQVFASLGLPVTLDFDSVFSAPVTPTIAVSHPAVGIAPFARYTNKTYPPEQMLQVIRCLVDEGIYVYLFGAKGDEAKILDQWAMTSELVTSVAGKMDITDEIAMMQAMDIMVTMDSANHHLASIAGTRTLSIWGSTTPACGFGAYGQNNADAICLNLDCQPCTVAGSENCPLGTLACMRQLAPKTVADRIIKAVAEQTDLHPSHLTSARVQTQDNTITNS